MQRDDVERGLRAMGIEPTGYTGQWVQAHCPFTHLHPRGSDRNPSFGVSVNNPSIYHCFTCGSKGAFKNIVDELDMPAADASRLRQELTLSEATSVKVNYTDAEIQEMIPGLDEDVYGTLFPPITTVKEAENYCLERDVTAEDAEYIGMKVWPEAKRIMFPIRGFTGKLYGWTGRTYDPEGRPKVWNQKGITKANHLLGSEHVSGERPLVVVEGLFIYAAFHALGIPEATDTDVVAIMGAEMSDEQADQILSLGVPVVLFLDGDKAGQRGTFGDDKVEGAVHMLSRSTKTYYVEYPRGIIDPDDLETEQIVDMIEEAKPYVRRRRRS